MPSLRVLSIDDVGCRVSLLFLVMLLGLNICVLAEATGARSNEEKYEKGVGNISCQFLSYVQTFFLYKTKLAKIIDLP